MKAGVIGNPVQHSLSPLIFKILSKELVFLMEYEKNQLSTEKELELFLNQLRGKLDWCGVNVTLPYKEIARQWIDIESQDVQKIGALNVISVHQGQLVAHNTDGVGLQKTFQALNFNPQGKQILILGAGGAARALCWECASAKGLYVYSRSQLRFQKLLKDFPKISEMRFSAIDLVVNATPVGLQESDSSDFFEILQTISFAPGAIALDLLYHKTDSLFLKQAARVPLILKNGLTMLVAQAVQTWELWTKIKVSSEVFETVQKRLQGFLAFQEKKRPIFLCGFMGVGKTTVGKKLAEILDCLFFDLDHEIEKYSGQSIQALFLEGEDSFREWERRTLLNSMQTCQGVIALGGGTLHFFDHLSRIKQAGTLIYLHAELSLLEKRLKNNEKSRPLLKKGFQWVQQCMAQREPMDRQAHQTVVCSEGMDVEQVAYSILEILGGE